ncbi:MAG: hypothetical protein IJA91_04335 [Clostridia bacterium]|nr:hypothetical protein [Clostridia bacterium]
MKSYREIADSVFARRDQYIIQQRKKKQTITRVTASVGSVALVSLAGFSLLRSDAFRDTPPITDGGAATTTTKPTEEKLLITADEPDGYENTFECGFYRDHVILSPLLQEKLEQYRDADVLYAVAVIVPYHIVIGDDFWRSTEELAQFHKEYYDVYNAFESKAKELNPSWNGRDAESIEIWTDEMRENYEYWLTLIEKLWNYEAQDFPVYRENAYKQRCEAVTNICEAKPIENVPCKGSAYEGTAYYAELTAEQINTLVEQGGYIFCLASPDGIEKMNIWDFE